MTYSTDFCRKIIAIKRQDSLTTEEAAKRIEIGTASFSRWNKSRSVPLAVAATVSVN